ncbi:hypothetical protein [Kaarinaea lacus]
MAFPLGTVLAAAPSVISAAADIIRVIKEKKSATPQADSDKLDELVELVERQAQVIEELALNNSNLALAVKNNRILSAVSIGIGFCAIALSIWY